MAAILKNFQFSIYVPFDFIFEFYAPTYAGNDVLHIGAVIKSNYLCISS